MRIAQQISNYLSTAKFWVFSSSVLSSFGNLAVRMIQTDSKKGYLQEPLRDTYRSAEYMRRKAARFNRVAFTNKVKGYTKQSRKVGGYTGQISSTRTDYVDMRLTGHLMDNLRVVGTKPFAQNQSVMLTFDPSDKDKIRGNERLGRSVRTLNEKNGKKLVREISREIKKNIGRSISKDLSITIEM